MESYETLYDCICRLCLKYNKSDNMIPLYDNSGKINYYGQAVTKFAEILLKKGDCLPPLMCKKCLLLLKQCVYFKLTCESTDRKLRQIKNLVPDNYKQRVIEYTLFKFNNLLNSTDTLKNIPQNTLKKNKTKSIDITPKIDNNLNDNNKNSFDWFYEIENETSNADTKIEPIGKKCDYPDVLNNVDQSVLSDKDINTEILPVKPKRRLRQKVRQQIIKNEVKRRKRINGQNFVCNICNKVLANHHTYENHMQRHNGCRYICEHCGKGFPVLAHLQGHQVVIHGTGPYLQCQHCPFKAPRKFELTEHLRIHTGERPFACDKCGLTFRRRYIWKKHLIYHTEKSIQCTLCPKKFFLRSHMLAHHNNVHDRVYMFVCGKCGVTYAKLTSVRRHMVDRHGIPREMQGKILRVRKNGGLKE